MASFQRERRERGRLDRPAATICDPEYRIGLDRPGRPSRIDVNWGISNWGELRETGAVPHGSISRVVLGSGRFTGSCDPVGAAANGSAWGIRHDGGREDLVLPAMVASAGDAIPARTDR